MEAVWPYVVTLFFAGLVGSLLDMATPLLSLMQFRFCLDHYIMRKQAGWLCFIIMTCLRWAPRDPSPWKNCSHAWPPEWLHQLWICMKQTFNSALPHCWLFQMLQMKFPKVRAQRKLMVRVRRYKKRVERVVKSTWSSRKQSHQTISNQRLRSLGRG